VLAVALDQLGGGVVSECQEDEEECYRLTFLGVLLADQGRESEELLVRYLTFVRDRFRTDPRVEWVGSQEVETALGLTRERSRLLRQLIRLSHWWGGGSGFGSQEWTVGVPIDVDDLPAGSDLRGYVRDHVLRHFAPELFLGEPGSLTLRPQASTHERPRDAFWFVRDQGLRRQLAMDWHEAQDVRQVRGWKSCVVLCGGILEAVLQDALSRSGPPATPGVSADSGGRNLADLVEAATTLGILPRGALPFGPKLLGFRNLIRPDWQIRESIEVTKEDSEAALNAVKACLRQVAALT
ncbi:MAG TPA: hypothetical protein VEU07_00005, partial [Candidatus Acidoferrum sp.]|nr:hypothetical protein [Candidatus Acidoferrum sp.]